LKWYTQTIIAMLLINTFVWAGLTALPTTVATHYNISEPMSPVEQIVGTWAQVSDNPWNDTQGWGTHNATALNESVTTESTSTFTITGDLLGGFLGGTGQAFTYILGFLGSIAQWFGAIFYLIKGMGVPQPWPGIINIGWIAFFLFALVALITGRDV